jgi:IS1 family transposase
MNRMSTEDRRRIVACLVEGMSIRATCRLTGAAKGTVLKLLADLGRACAAFHDERVRGLECQRVQADELWCFCYAKAKTVSRNPHLQEMDGVGDVWTWTGMDADTKLMVSWHVGTKSPESAQDFANDLAGRVQSRMQLTTDGNRNYFVAIRDAFGENIDYAMLTKIYGDRKPDGKIGSAELEVIGVRKARIVGDPNMAHVSTSFVERQNLTLRMCSRRWTRLTNAFSKKLENLCHSLAIHYVFYNFARVHQTLKATPAMAAGLMDRPMTLEWMIGLLEVQEQAAIEAGALKRGPYRKRISN